MKGTIVGNLGKDAELKQTDAGKTRVVFSIADTVGWGDNKKTQWVNCTIFGERGEKLKQYLTKGLKVVVFGEVSVRDYTDKNGIAKWSIDCVVSDVVLCGGKSAADSSHDSVGGAPKVTIDNDEIPF